jgi:hypothetical protein
MSCDDCEVLEDVVEGLRARIRDLERVSAGVTGRFPAEVARCADRLSLSLSDLRQVLVTEQRTVVMLPADRAEVLTALERVESHAADLDSLVERVRSGAAEPRPRATNGGF